MSDVQANSEAFAERPPEPQARPPFAFWLWERGLTPRSASRRLGRVSYETIRKICLPWNDEDRTEPSDDLAQRIDLFTGGACPPSSFKAPGSSDDLGAAT